MSEKPGLSRILIVSWLPLEPADSGYKSRVVHLSSRLSELCEVCVLSPGEEPRNRSFSWRRVDRGEGRLAPRVLARLPKGKVLSTFSPTLTESIVSGARELQPQAIVAEGLWGGAAALKAAAATDAKSVIVVQNIESKSARGVYPFPIPSLLASYERYLYRKADLLIVLSQEDCDDLERSIGKGHPPIEFIPNGTEPPSPATKEEVETLRLAWHVREGERVVLFSGRLDYPPNRLALEWFSREVFPHLKETSLPIRWMVVGAPIPVSSLPPFEFVGYVESLNAALGSADVCISPVRHGSGTSIKLLDYLGAGKPVVSTSVGARGLPIQPDVHYLPARTPKQFAEKIVELLENPDRASALGKTGREAIESELTWERSAKDVFSRLTELIRS